MDKNCSDIPPRSDDFLSELSVAEKVFVGLATALCIGVLALFADKVWFIHRHYGNYGRQELIKHKAYTLVGIYPITAVVALMAVYIPRSGLLCDFLSSVYLAVCLYQFTSLIVLYFGGTAQLLDTTHEVGFNLRTPPCCCCCFCCPKIASNKKNLTRLQLLVLQTAFLQPVISFVSVVLWLDGQYNPYVTRADSPSTYTSILQVISTLLAMYGLIVLYRSTCSFLAMYSIRSKLLVLQLILIIDNIQKFILKILADKDIPSCRGILSSRVRSDGIHHMLVVAEMFLLAVLARIIYRRPIQQEMEDGYNRIAREEDDLEHLMHSSRVSEENGTASGKPSYCSIGETVRVPVSSPEGTFQG